MTLDTMHGGDTPTPLPEPSSDARGRSKLAAQGGNRIRSHQATRVATELN